MATYARKLKDTSGNYIAPATRASCVYMSDNTTLEDFVNNLDLRVTGIYPVGSVYQSFSESSPASLFGGEWEKLENTFLYGSGTKTVNETGGEETHQLTVEELAEHDHTFTGQYHQSTRILMTGNLTSYAQNTSAVRIQYCETASSNPTWTWSCLTWTDAGTIGSNGSGSAHNNMPPYTVLNIWKRVA